MNSSSIFGKDIKDAVQGVQNLLKEKLEQLEREKKAFEHRVDIFEKANPAAGKDADILSLNIGGVKRINILRSTLTQYEDSMMAAQFSGRWDHSLPKDKDGNIFVDQDSDEFLTIISFLRMTANRQRPDLLIRPPEATFKLCSVLEYYNLMPAFYPSLWTAVDGAVTISRPSYGVVEITADGDPSTVLSDHEHAYGDLEVSSFTVLVPGGTPVQVGWADAQSAPQEFNLGMINGSFGLNVENGIFCVNGELSATSDQWHEANADDHDLVIRCSLQQALDGSIAKVSISAEREDGEAVVSQEWTKWEGGRKPVIKFGNCDDSVVISEVQFSYPYDWDKWHVSEGYE